ncbi:sulfite exporter TauE/SafE family protein [Thermomonas sp.]|uniref:sulfite exporter TauE/SafE family protein n=1 Tax=Thermomonas sp. TaxID=1971895 RepID=UPI00260266BE|nr:sulfite exporter TauE/SafE family protein [Thermomonas sp.]
MLFFAIYLLLGLCVGLLAGLLGIGGGLVLVAALAWLLPMQGVPVDVAMHAALASSLASIVLTAASSARAHHRRGSVLWPTVAWMVPGILLGGWLGSRFAIGLDGNTLRWCVAGYCYVVSLQMLFSKTPQDGGRTTPPAGPGYTAAGGGIGLVSAIVGIGGGSLTVPLLVWRRVVPVRAVGTSSACGIFIGLGSALGYALQAPTGALTLPGAVGYVYLPASIGVALASVLAAPWGTRLAHALSGAKLKRIFAVFMLLVGSSFAYGALA